MFSFNKQNLIKDVSNFYRNVLNANLSQQLSDNIIKFFEFIEADAGWQTLEQINSFFIQTGIETGWRFAPIKEIQARSGKVKTLQDKYWYTGYYGRGYLQITHKANYEKMSKILGIDLVSNPDILLKNWALSYKASAIGFQRGVFTGKKISDYINKSKVDYKNARRVVNGSDKAELIDRLCKQFIRILTINLIPQNKNIRSEIISIETESVTDPDTDPVSSTHTEVSVTPAGNPNQSITIGVEKVVPQEANGWNTWKTTITAIIAAISTPIATISAWFKGVTLDPFILKALVFLSISTILIGFLFGLAFMIIRILMKHKEQERAHELTLAQMRLVADPTKFNVKVMQ